MPRWFGFGRSSNRLAERIGNPQAYRLSEILSALSPVQIVGTPDYRDEERPQFSISTITSDVAGEVGSSSLTSGADVAVEAMSAAAFSGGGLGRAGALTLFTVASTYIPFLNNAAFWYPDLRPRLDYSVGRTIAVTGTNPLVSGDVGWQFFSTIDWNDNARDNTIYFQPALILPATMFLCVQRPTPNQILLVNWRYRELA